MENLKLYTRLKKDDFIKIKAYAKKYPTLGKNFKDMLKSNDNIYSLKVFELIDINNILLNSKYYHLIDIYEISKKFNLIN